jgi:Fic family protein
MFPPKNIMQLNQLAILQTVDKLKNDIDGLRPFPVDVESRVLQKLRFDWNYHSNAMEGNSLNYGETIALLMEGVTAKGKPLRDHLDIRGHNEIVYYLLDIVREKREISEADIRNLHKIMLVEDSYVAAETEDGLATRKLIKVGEYKTETNYTITETGEKNYFASPQQVPARMYALINWYRKARLDSEVHPIVAAALFHYEFVAIHPFADGNGRMARWLMNLVLLQNYYPITVLKQEKRKFYYVTLQKANQGDFTDFVEFVAEAVLNSLQIYQKAINGENIHEPNDLDKEIALFGKELQGGEDKIELKRSVESQKIFYENSLKPLVENLELTVAKFKIFFLGQATQLNNYAELFMSKNLVFSDIKLNFELKNFKSTKNIFSLSLLVYFILDDFYCSFYYDVVDSILFDEANYLRDTSAKKFLCKKLYHDQLAASEIQDICTQIGLQLLKVIKEKSQT